MAFAAIQPSDSFASIAGTDAIQIENARVAYQANKLTRQFLRATFGNRPSKMLGKYGTLDFDVELAGSGTVGTAGPVGLLLRACGMAETTVAATPAATIASAPTAVATPTGTFTYTRTTAYAGAVARTATLTCTTAGASGVARFTVAAPAIGGIPAYNETGVLMTNATAFALPNGAVIPSTVGTSFIIGDAYTIALVPAGVEYQPSSDRNNHEKLSLQTNFELEQHRFVSGRGTAKFKGLA